MKLAKGMWNLKKINNYNPTQLKLALLPNKRLLKIKRSLLFHLLKHKAFADLVEFVKNQRVMDFSLMNASRWWMLMCPSPTKKQCVTTQNLDKIFFSFLINFYKHKFDTKNPIHNHHHIKIIRVSITVNAENSGECMLRHHVGSFPLEQEVPETTTQL